MTDRAVISPRCKVLVLTAKPGLSITQIRLGEPLAHICRDGALAHRIKGLKDALINDLLWADVVILQREASRVALKWALTTKRMGRWLVFELDDLLFAPAEHLTHRAGILENADRLRKIAALADRISVSTPRLKAALPAELHAKAFVTPNYAVPPARAPAAHSHATQECPITLVLASSDAMSLSSLLQTLKALQANPPCPLDIFVIGAMAEPLRQAGLNVRTSPSMPLEAFKDLLCQQSNPVGLIPLDNSPFSACKSAIKHFDFAVCGVPSICSDLPPYNDVISSGIDGLLVPDDATAWLDSVTNLCTDRNLRQKLATQARLHVIQSHNLMQNSQAWSRLLETLPPGRDPRQRPSAVRRTALYIQLGPLQRVRIGLRQLNEKRKQKR